MGSPELYTLAANAVLLLQVLVVIFIIFCLAFIYIGYFLAWSWIRNPWFRLLHLLAICSVVVLSWLNFICPLTVIEMALRTRSGETAYSGSFITHWLKIILYYQAPSWVFVSGYTLFGIIVVASWFIVRPHHFRAKVK